jgi:uncharacterized protein (TIGR03437 family)
VSKEQINLQVPFGLSANTQHQISVRRGQELSVPETLTVTEAIPGIFAKNRGGTGQGLVYRKDPYVLAEPGSPAAAGEQIIVYCSGLGAVSPPVTEGEVTPSQPAAQVGASVELTIGGKKAQVLSSRLAPNFVGVYEISAVVPEGTPPGDALSVTVTAGGLTSPPVTMAVR